MALACVLGPLFLNECAEVVGRQFVIAREIGDRRGEAIASWNMATELEKLGDLDRAIELAQILVHYERELGHPDAESHGERVAAMRARLASGE